MATPAFGAALEASLKQPIQGGVLVMNSGLVDNPLFFCCISGNTVGVDKSPVPSLIVIPQDACEGVLVDADFSHSWSPTSTIDTWEIDWGDGNVTGPNAWPGAGHATHAYTLPAGETCHTYDITLTITDVLAATGLDMKQVVVCACPADPLAPFCCMVGGATAGPFYTEALAGGATVWHGLDLGSLAAAGAKACHVLKEYHWQDGHISIFMGTDCGIYEYVVPTTGSPYGGTWVRVIYPVDILGPLGIAGTVRVWDLQMVMDVEGHEGWGYIAFGVSSWPDVWEGAASTRDGWQTIHAIGLAYTDIVNFRSQMCAIAQHTPTTVYVTCEDGLHRSTNSGAGYTFLDAGAGPNEHTVHVPWHSPSWDDRIITHAGDGGVRRSVDGLDNFFNIGTLGRPQHMYGPTYDASRLWASDWGGSGRANYWDPVGGVQTFGPTVCAVGCHNNGGGVLVADATYFPVSWLLCGDGAAAGVIKLNTVAATVNCTGDWNAKTGSDAAWCMLHRTSEPWAP